MTAATVACLEAVDVDAVDADALVEMSQAWTRVANHAAGERAVVLAALQRMMPAGPVIGAREATVAEIAAALALGMGAADVLIDASGTLAARLPATLAAVRSGAVGWDKAVVLAQHTVRLSLDQARAVEERVLPFAARRTPARHAAAVRRAVDRVDPDGMDERHRQARRDVALIRAHHGDGMGELFARMPSDQLDTVWTAADVWARRRKAAGDPRTLDQLRVEALVQWGRSFLVHGDPTVCDTSCDPLPFDHDDDGPDDGGDDDDPEPDDGGPGEGGPGDGGPQGPDADGSGGKATPVRHGRQVSVRVVWDLPSLLGVTHRCGELADSTAVLPPSVLRDIVTTGGVRVRRLLIDPATGRLLDLTGYLRLPGPLTCTPFTLDLVIPADLRDALRTRDLTRLDPDQATEAAAILGALTTGHPLAGLVRDLLAAPVTAAALDAHPTAEQPSPALAEFVAVRDRHPTNPTAGHTAASAGDLDHTIPRNRGGPTTAANLTPLTRRWHRLRTHGGWTVRHHGHHWQWTSPLGRTHTTEPHDYRLGP